MEAHVQYEILLVEANNLVMKLRAELEEKETEKKQLLEKQDDMIHSHEETVADLKRMLQRANDEILKGAVEEDKEKKKLTELRADYKKLEDAYVKKCTEIKQQGEDKDKSKKALQRYMEKCIEIYFEEEKARPQTGCLIFCRSVVSSYLAFYLAGGWQHRTCEKGC